MVGALSGVPQDVPPFVTAVVARPQKGPSLYGLNVIGLKRNKFSEQSIAALKKAYRVLFRSGAPMSEAISKVEAEVEPLPEVRRLVEFIRSSKRGVLR
jgi:UDP-N-acetylglucosamine acyltransferase